MVALARLGLFKTARGSIAALSTYSLCCLWPSVVRPSRLGNHNCRKVERSGRIGIYVDGNASDAARIATDCISGSKPFLKHGRSVQAYGEISLGATVILPHAGSLPHGYKNRLFWHAVGLIVHPTVNSSITFQELCS